MKLSEIKNLIVNTDERLREEKWESDYEPWDEEYKYNFHVITWLQRNSIT